MGDPVEDRIKRLTKRLMESSDEGPSSVSQAIAPTPPPAPPTPFKPVSTFVRPTLEGLGMAGDALVTAPLSPVGQAAGGALGYAGGSALADVAETLAGERQAPTSFKDVLDRTSTLLQEGGLTEAGGRIINKGLEAAKVGGKSLLRAIIGGQVSPITPEQQLLVHTAEQMGLHLRPSEITGSDTAAQIEQNARRSLFGRGKFQKLDETNSRNLVDFYDTYAEQSFGIQQSPQELGRLVQDAVQGTVVPEVQAVNRGLFQIIQRQTGEIPIVRTNEVLPKANELRDTFDPKVFPKSYEIANKIADIVSERGPTTGLHVRRMDIPIESEPTTALRGLKVKTTSETSPAPLSTGLKVRRIEGDISPEAQAIEDLGGKKAEPPLLGLSVRKKSDAPQLPLPIGLNVQRLEETIPGEKTSQLGRLQIRETSETPRIPKTLTFMQAHDARSMLLDLTRTGEVLSSREKAVASKLAGALDDAMEQAAKRFDQANGTNVMHDWRIANASIAASHELFDSAVIRKAMSSTPEDVVKIAFSRNALTETDRVMAALRSSPNGVQTYRQAAFRDLLERSRNRHDQSLNPQAMYQAAYGKGGVGDAVMQKTFGEYAEPMKRFITAASKSNMGTAAPNTEAAQTGRSLINWFEQGMILSVPVAATTGGMKGATLAVGSTGLYVLSMDQLARLVNSPRGLSLLTQALPLKAGTREASRVGGLLLKKVTEINAPDIEEAVGMEQAQ